ncbi:MAG: hypothetical protein N2C12_11945, partial [Planctomycetales bacterium]
MIRNDLATTDNNHRYNLFQLICSVYRTANAKKIGRTASDLKRFAFEEAPQRLQQQTNNYSHIVGQLADTLHDVASPRDGLAFLIDRIQNEPAWLRYRNESGWQRHAWRLGQWRGETQPLGNLEPRLLAIVLNALQRDLSERRQVNRSIYTRNNSHYWADKEKDFMRTAENVYQQSKESGAAVAYISEYVFHGLRKYDRAIDMMWEGQRQGRLDESGQAQLVGFLHHQHRYVESVPLLQGLIELRPDNIHYRTQLMVTFYRTDRDEDLLGLLGQTDSHFHQNGLWTESNMAALAAGCLQTKLFKESAAYYEELIPLHQRTAPRRGIGDGTLSGYYSSQANAYAG